MGEIRGRGRPTKYKGEPKEKMTLYLHPTIHLKVLQSASRNKIPRSAYIQRALDIAHTKNEYALFFNLIAQVAAQSFEPYWRTLGIIERK